MSYRKICGTCEHWNPVMTAEPDMITRARMQEEDNCPKLGGVPRGSDGKPCIFYNLASDATMAARLGKVLVESAIRSVE